MESSAISLYFSLLRKTSPDAAPTPCEHLINLIDSPGHIDFSSEVSTASRLCDGALVLVDAVEGVCSQTVTVLRQTWTEKLKPLLVINKMDRLVTELKMTPAEAYTHLNKLLEQVNAIMGSFFQGERMENDLRWRERLDQTVAAAANKLTDDVPSRPRKGSLGEDAEGIIQDGTPADYEEDDDESIYFTPENNNVIFSSAIDGWAFTPRQFAGIYEKKLGIKRSVLEKVLWGDYYLDPKTKRILGSKHLKGRNLKPLFVQLVLDNIWAVYEATIGGSNAKGDPALLEKISKALNITIPPHVLRSKDTKNLLTTVFSSWLPLSTAVLVSVVENLPSPPTAQAARLPALIESSPGSAHVDPKIRSAMCDFDKSPDAPVVAYISKMVAVPESEMPSNKRKGGTLTAEEARELGRKKRAEIARAQALASGESSEVNSVTDAFSATAIGDDDELAKQTTNGSAEEAPEVEHLIGFARVYSGILKVGDEVYVLRPKFTPARPHAAPEPKKVKITALYLLMGRSMEDVVSAPAGSIVGIAGLEGAILKSGTICTYLEGAPNLSSTGAIGTNAPIVRVALEPAWPTDLDKMIKGLKMLEQADPAVIYEQMESGEHVIVGAGELHLERCLKDLRERFAKCDIQAGEVIVPYRESIVRQEEMRPPKDAALGRGRVEVSTNSKQLTIRIAVRPLPATVTEFLVKNAGAIKRLYSEKQAAESTADTEEVASEADIDIDDAADDSQLSLEDFKKQLSAAFASVSEDKDIWRDVSSKIVAFGPRRTGPNLFIDATESSICSKFLVGDESSSPSTQDTDGKTAVQARDFVDKISHAFQLFCHQGPLCAEPLQGVSVFLESITLSPTSSSSDVGRLTGETITTAREAMRSGFLDWSPRLLLAMYSCEIQAAAEVLGRVYGVITRRRGRIVSESLLEPSPNFTVVAMLPVAESWGFADEMRKRSSGAAAPQLVFEGFEALDIDPYWVPTTEEELEDLGEKGDRENVALRYVDKVRERKGMFVKRKVVEHGEKQKTLKR